MRNRNEPTVVAKATQYIDGYEEVYTKLQQQGKGDQTKAKQEDGGQAKFKNKRERTAAS